ncbi:hypothetical protein BYT27DRAFT_7217987 [Phlegmacium glaucopus]|nr:hypothetical protein BYT27DRAFT_7217987 [Phlegmacium glaucopus]
MIIVKAGSKDKEPFRRPLRPVFFQEAAPLPLLASVFFCNCGYFGAIVLADADFVTESLWKCLRLRLLVFCALAFCLFRDFSSTSTHSSMSHPDEQIENIQAITEACGKLVEDTINGRYMLADFGRELRKTGISVVEAADYVQEVKQRLEGRHDDVQPTNSTPISTTSPPTSGQDAPASSSTPEIETHPDPSATEVNEEIAWALLTSKLNCERPMGSSDSPRIENSVSDVLKALVPSSSSNSSIPPSVLAIAPHLATLSHSEKAIDPIIDLMQCQHLPDPIPRSIWRKIIQDEFVDFERLYGSTDRNYSHQDDQKEFAGGFVLTKKEQMSAKKAVGLEAEWSRTCYKFPFWYSFSVVQTPLPNAIRTLLLQIRLSVRLSLVKIGVWASVMIPVLIGGNTGFAANVEDNTERRSSKDVLGSCGLVLEARILNPLSESEEKSLYYKAVSQSASGTLNHLLWIVKEY